MIGLARPPAPDPDPSAGSAVVIAAGAAHAWPELGIYTTSDTAYLVMIDDGNVYVDDADGQPCIDGARPRVRGLAVDAGRLGP